jgi:hypothetical protein
MPFKHGELEIQELGSRSQKNRDDEDLARHGKKQQFEASVPTKSPQDPTDESRETLVSCPC